MNISSALKQISDTVTAIAATDFSSPIQSIPTRMVQNFLLVWLDTNIDEANESFQKSLTELQNIVRIVEQFTDADECINYMTTIEDVKIFLMISEALSENIVPLVHDLAQLDVIFIFDESNVGHTEWENKWPKIQGYFDSIESICKRLETVARECDHDAIPMSFVSNQVTIETTASSNQTIVDKLPPSFMYSMLFKEIILEIDEDDAKPLADLAQYCRQNKISEFQLNLLKRDYHKKSPIWLYTCEIFIYSMLNKALRSLDLEAMVKMGFFIRNLHKQLKQLHEQQAHEYNKEFSVYRGQGLSPDDFQNLRDTKGGLLSFNNFLSTSMKQESAITYAHKVLQKSRDTLAVLFIMNIDATKISSSTTPFALIDENSAFPQEKEILFSMHTVFRVDEIKETDSNNRLYEVQLTLTDNRDAQLAGLTHRMREEIDGSGWYRMGKLMLKVGHFNQAEVLYNELLPNSSSDHDLADIYHQLACVRKDRGEYKEAALLLEKSLEIEQKSVSEDHPSLAPYYNNIGLMHKTMGDYSKGLKFYEKALKIREIALNPNHPDLAESYNNIGLTYNDMGDYSKALEYHGKAIKIKEIALLPNHPDFAISYDNIGTVYYKMGDFSKALDYYGKANTIFEIALPSNHPDLATSYNNIGAMYHSMNDYSKALEFYEKACEIWIKSLPSNHPLLATSYNNIGYIYNNMSEYSKALEYYGKAHAIKELALPSNHPDLATSYNNIGAVYDSMDDYSKALEFYGKACEIWGKSLPSNHPLLATSYSNIGTVYGRMGDYSKSLEYYTKAHEINKIALPPNHPHLAALYSSIAEVYNAMDSYSKALEYYGEANKIFEITLPPNHLNLATSYNSIGLLYKNMDDCSRALEYFEKALKIRETALPPNHPDLASSYSNISRVYNDMGDCKKALEYYEKAHEIWEITLPPNHLNLATSYNSIGLLYNNIGEYSKALSSLEKALDILQRSLPPTHPKIKNVINGINYVKNKM